MKLSDDLTVGMYGYLQQGRTADIILPNFYLGFWEMDIIHLKKSGYLTEYEIKISKADFLNDFKKSFRGDTKHQMMADKKSVCNRFSFVTPEGLLKPEDIPTHAGWIEGTKGRNGIWRMFVRKPAPLLHKNKHFDTAEKYRELASKLSFRENNFRNKLNQLKKNGRKPDGS